MLSSRCICLFFCLKTFLAHAASSPPPRDAIVLPQPDTFSALQQHCPWYTACLIIYSVSQKKNPPYGFLNFFPKRLGIFNRFFTHLLYYHFYTRLQIFIHISPILTKLCHTKCDHLVNFYISLELYLLSLLTEQMTSFLTSCHIPHVC